MNPKRLIIVSNRLPYRISEKKGQLNITASSGGLVSSIHSYIKKTRTGKKEQTPVLWVGTADINEKKFKEYAGYQTIVHDDIDIHPVFLPALVADKHYNGFCNNSIWPLFHYFPSYSNFNEEYFEHFKTANHLFAEKLAELYQPGDLIWIHDYHLMLLPAMLRNTIPSAPIGFFLHIPFPSFEIFRILPNKWRSQILKGILGADLVGFHTYSYAQHFLKSVRQILGYDTTMRAVSAPDRSIIVDKFPVGIDFDKFYNASENSETVSERNKIKKRLDGMQIITSVDRLDYTKGIPSRLKGFELFLEKYPEYKGKVVYVLIVVPSRDIIVKYKENKREIEELISRINGKYNTIEWTPIIYQYRSLDFKKLSGMYLSSDAALIAPVRDGMNLVAKEYVASRRDKSGVLILSETAGAAEELGEALIVNPIDKEEIADTIHQALTMSLPEQVRRNKVMQERLKHYDVVNWVEDFISKLMQWKEGHEHLKIKELTTETIDIIIEKYQVSKNRVVLLDYDGTLVPFASMPHQAEPSAELLNMLSKLAGDKKNRVVIMSGRNRQTLEKWLGHLPIDIVAEHGGFFKLGGNKWKQVMPINTKWKAQLMPILKIFTERCPGTFIEEKTLSVAWHYRNAEKEMAFLRSRELLDELMGLSANLDFHVLEGHKVIEARARGIDKGAAASTLLQQSNYDFILAIGDDRTDEDLFKVIPDKGYSIRVGLTQSDARYNLRHQKDVPALLEKLVRITKTTTILMPEQG